MGGTDLKPQELYLKKSSPGREKGSNNQQW
jgi:hypothetical protein